jgi:uncharacterized membrane protein
LIILGVSTNSEQGYQLYQEAILHFQIPKERLGVPTLIVGETVLVGSLEIPTQFPVIVEQGLESDIGIDWPDLPGLKESMEAEYNPDPEMEPTETEENIATETEMPDMDSKIQTPDPPQSSVALVDEKSKEENKETALLDEGNGSGGIDYQQDAGASENISMSQRFARDKFGNTISVFVLMGMMLSVVAVGVTIAKPGTSFKPWPAWVVPILVLIGIGVAVYMGYVEITQSEAVCGPVGDCNTVQQSSYAFLFGLVPIGAFGVIGYILIGLIWLVFMWGPSRWRKVSSFALWGLAVFGTLFSIYLTFLEPFVIGATCAWCLTSAILMALLLWASTSYLVEAWNA